MYTPPHFREDRLPILAKMIEASPFATLVVATAQGLEATHVPMLFDTDHMMLTGHVARANPIASLNGSAALAIFHGPHEYISPSLYASKQNDPRVVPTWNYVAVHASGTLRTFIEPDRLRSVVGRLTAAMERSRPAPWSIDDAPADYIARLVNAITGIELRVEKLEGKWKVSQNRPDEDRRSVADALEGTPMGALVREASG